MKYLNIIILLTLVLTNKYTFSKTTNYEISMDCLNTENKLNKFAKVENKICIIDFTDRETCYELSSSDESNLTYVTESKNQIQIIDFKNKKVTFTIENGLMELKCKNLNQYNVKKKKDLNFKNLANDELNINLENAKEIFLNKKIDLEKKIYASLLDWDYIIFQDNIKTIEDLRKEIELTIKKGNFIDAIKKIDEIHKEILNTNQKLEKNFIRFFKKAKSDYENLYYLSADESINNALKLKPDDVEAKQLQSKIEILPKKIEILKKIETARIENNKKKELAFLQDLNKLQDDPQLNMQINKLSNLIVKLDYQKKISKTEKFLKDSNISEAEKFLTEARRILPNGEEILVLQGKLKKIKEEHLKKKLYFRYNIASKNDDWESSLLSLREILTIEKNDADVKEKIEMVEEILSLKKKMINHSRNTHRLTNKKFMNLVVIDLKRAEKYLDVSPSLLKNYEKVSKVLKESEEKVAVKIISDNETLIEIRGIGKVGKVKEKIIKLSPGKYYFVGKRNGFRDSFLDIDLSKTGNIEIEIICMEQI